MSLRSFVRAFPLVTLAFILVCAGLTGCAGGDMATVTISVSHPDFAKTHTPSFFDRMLAFLSMSTRLEAQSAPPSGIEQLKLTVSAADMSTITADIPIDSGSITLTVPSGNARTFRIKALRAAGMSDYSGSATMDLGPGSTSVTIQMSEVMVYIAGSNVSGQGCYWTNGAITNFTTTQEILALAMTPNGLYKAGHNNYQPGYWRADNAWEPVTNGPSVMVEGIAKGLFSSGGNMYVSYNDITDGSGMGYFSVTPSWSYTQVMKSVNSIYVWNGQVFLVGINAGPTTEAQLWRNGILATLDTPAGTTYAYAFSIVVDNGVAYTAGGYTQEGIEYPVVWRNSARTNMLAGDTYTGNASSATDIYIAGGSFYVCGYYFNGSISVPCYWVNGTRIELPTPDGTRQGRASAIYVTPSGDVYICGYYYTNGYHACYWKNGVRQDLVSGNIAVDIVVVES